MSKSLIKIISLLIVIGFYWAGLLAIGETFAYLNDVEISFGNSYSAGTLDFSLFSGQENFVPLKKALNLKPGEEVNRVIQVRNEGSLPFQYRGQTKKFFGDNDFCNALKLKANLEGKKIYEGNLMDFNFSPIEISNSGIDTWHFKVSLPEDSNFENKICQIKFVFDGWQTNFFDPSTGFFDQEEIESHFASASLSPDKEISETEEEMVNEDSNEEEIVDTKQEAIEETTSDNPDETVEVVGKIEEEETTSDGALEEMENQKEIEAEEPIVEEPLEIPTDESLDGE